MGVWARNSRSYMVGILVGVFSTLVFVAVTGPSGTGVRLDCQGEAAFHDLGPPSSDAKIQKNENHLSDSKTNEAGRIQPANSRRALKLTNNALESGDAILESANAPGDDEVVNDVAIDDHEPDVDNESHDDDEFVFDAARGLADRTRKYATHPFVKSGSQWNQLVESYPVCMATQTSVDRMYWLANVTETWTGPISAAIFIPDVEYELAKAAIKFLRRCSQAVRERVSFHFVSDVAHPPVERISEELSSSATGDRQKSVDELLSCDSIHDSLIQLVNVSRSAEMMSWRDSMIYPQQLLRNVARQGCPTPYVTLVDVDMIPKQGLADELRTFLGRDDVQECEKCAFVIPVYEIADEAGSLPSSKTQLLGLIGKKMARPFHKVIAARNSGSSNLPVWEKIKEKPGGLQVAYEVQKFMLQYEPIYVARSSVPQFDERFEGFGCTRWTQAYEMLASGYKFKLLDKAFLSHWGFQILKTRPKWRARQQEENNRRLEQYSKEFVAKYGQDPLNLVTYAKKAKRIVIAYGN